MDRVELEKLFLKQFPGNIFWKDLNGEILAVNEVLAAAYGFDNPDMIYAWLERKSMVCEDIEQIRRNDLEVIGSCSEKTFVETAVIQSTGKRIRYIVKKFPLYDSSGNLIGVQGFAFDYTVEIENQEVIADKHRKMELTLQTIVDNLPGNVYWHDYDGKILGCNIIEE